MSGYSNNSIFWVETDKVQPNPFQPRREFEQNALADLADSIRQYGVLQPLVVTRSESYREDGGMEVSYELIAGERRLRASKLAGLEQVPVIIRKETNEKEKLELAIIENLQREDLNPIDRALAFEQLYKEFSLTHAEIGKKMGKSRVYVSNTLRLLALTDTIKQALMAGKISEGHTRPLLMLVDRPEEQSTLFREIIVKNMSVRDAEKIARSVAQDKVRKKEFEVDPKIRVYEKKMSENLGTRVQIEPKEKGGKIVIDYFTIKDLDTILAAINKSDNKDAGRMMQQFIDQQASKQEGEQQYELSRSTPVSFQEEEIEEPKEKPVDPEPVSDFLTGNPYGVQEIAKEVPHQAEIPVNLPVGNEVPQTAPDYAAMYATPEPVVEEVANPEPVVESTPPSYQSVQPEQVATEEVPSYTPPVVTPSYEQPEATHIPQKDETVTSYPDGDPYLEEPVIARPDTPGYAQYDMQQDAQSRRVAESAQQQYQAPAVNTMQNQQYGNGMYQQQRQPQKRSFFKKLFG